MLGIVGLIVMQQALAMGRALVKRPVPAVVTDRAGRRHEYRLFFYDRGWRQYDKGLDWLARLRSANLGACSVSQGSTRRSCT